MPFFRSFVVAMRARISAAAVALLGRLGERPHHLDLDRPGPPCRPGSASSPARRTPPAVASPSRALPGPVAGHLAQRRARRRASCPVAAAYRSALAVASSTAASRARSSAASGSLTPSRRSEARTPLPPSRCRGDGLAALGEVAHGDPRLLGHAVAGEDRRSVGRVVVLGVHLQPGRLHVGGPDAVRAQRGQHPLQGGAGAGRAPGRARPACR